MNIKICRYAPLNSRRGMGRHILGNQEPPRVGPARIVRSPYHNEVFLSAVNIDQNGYLYCRDGATFTAHRCSHQLGLTWGYKPKPAPSCRIYECPKMSHHLQLAIECCKIWTLTWTIYKRATLNRMRLRQLDQLFIHPSILKPKLNRNFDKPQPGSENLYQLAEREGGEDHFLIYTGP